MLHTLLLVSATLLGACVGSFLNVVIYRVPRGVFRSMGSRSHCPACQKPISAFDNIPILSWLILRGKARCCGVRIAVRYPAIEALTAVLFLALAWVAPYGPLVSSDGREVYVIHIVAWAFQAVFVALLVAASGIDAEHRILPDVLTKPGMVLGVVGAFLAPGLAGALPSALGTQSLSPALHSVLASLLGLAVGFFSTWGVRILAHFVFKKQAMGFGDVKFMGMIGAFTGWEGALLTFFMASLLGAVGGSIHRLVTKDAYVPFGPFLAGGALCALFAKAPLIQFIFVTWPAWQRESTWAPFVLFGAMFACLLLLVVLVRRGRAS